MKHVIPQIERHTSIKNAIQIIDQSQVGTAFIVNEDGVYLGGVYINDLRRLLVSGVNEESEIGAYPVRYTHGIHEEGADLEAERQKFVADSRVSGAMYIPVLTATGEVKDILSVDDLEGSAPSPPTSFTRVLVVGGAGYLGSILTRKLLDRGYRVRVLDSFIYGRRSMADLEPNPQLEIIEGDLRNIHTCVSALEGVSALVLLAAIVGDPASKVRPTETIETNVLAAQALASACKLQHINRFLYASTCSVYGLGEDILDENAPLNPVSLYARSKIASEKIILGMGDEYFAPTILRMGTLYGFSHRMRFDLVVNTMTMKSFTEGKIRVFGGQQWRPLLYVGDAADVYIACLEAELSTVGNQVLNVGSDEQNYQIDDIASMVSESLGGIPIHRDSSSLDARDYRVSFEKIRELINFTPRGSITSASKCIHEKLRAGEIKDPSQRIYYNHYFDSTEE